MRTSRRGRPTSRRSRGPVSEAVRQQAKDALTEAEADLTAAAKDRRVTAQLLEMMVFGDSAPSGGGPEAVVQQGLFDADRRFAAVFRGWGLDPDQTPVADAAARIRSRPVAVATELIAALDHWAYLRDVHFVPSARRLFDLANAADQPDPLRQELRDCWLLQKLRAAANRGWTGSSVQALAGKVDHRREPTLTLLVLARALWEVGDQKTPLSLLDEAVHSPKRRRDALLWGQLGQMHCSLGAPELGQRAAAVPKGQEPTDEGKHLRDAVTWRRKC